jgi:hypothetical protein
VPPAAGRVGVRLLRLAQPAAVSPFTTPRRLKLEIDDSRNVLRVMDEDPASGQVVSYQQHRADEGVLFMAWNDAELAEPGFKPQEILVKLRCCPRRATQMCRRSSSCTTSRATATQDEKGVRDGRGGR